MSKYTYTVVNKEGFMDYCNANKDNIFYKDSNRYETMWKELSRGYNILIMEWIDNKFYQFYSVPKSIELLGKQYNYGNV